MSLSVLRGLLAALCGSLLITSPVFAVVVASGAANVTPPLNDPGFNNVGSVNGGSGVYLGNRWVLTAGHVGPGTFIDQGVTYLQDTSAAPVYLQNFPPNDTSGKSADAVLFRLQTDPGLPSLTIPITDPQPGQTVLMVGRGLAADGTGIHYYHHDISSTVYVEQAAPAIPGVGDSAGIVMTGASQPHWGENIIAQIRQDWTGYGKYLSLDFSTHFDHPPYYFPMGDPVLEQVLPNEAQAATGDSGGAGFIGGKLAGLIIAGTGTTSTPVIGNTAMFEDASYMVRLASYRQQILTITQISSPQVLGDFDLNGIVNSDDVTAMLKSLKDLTAFKNKNQLSDAELLEIGDLDGSGSVTNRDIQSMLDYLISIGGGSFTVVPEPATWVIVFAGMAVLLLMQLRAALRRRVVDSADVRLANRNA